MDTNKMKKATELLSRDIIESCKIEVFPDGNSWCALIGENLMEGLAGFGNTPYGAIEDLLLSDVNNEIYAYYNQFLKEDETPS